MGYSTDFSGRVELNKPLTDEDFEFLTDLSRNRRMKRKTSTSFGVEGEFYVKDENESDSSIIDFNSPPSTQPSLWCQWVPTDDRQGLEWDGGEKAYEMENWLVWIINRYLIPRGYVVNGEVDAYGEESGDIWAIRVQDNKVRILRLGDWKRGEVPDEDMTTWEFNDMAPVIEPPPVILKIVP